MASSLPSLGDGQREGVTRPGRRDAGDAAITADVTVDVTAPWMLLPRPAVMLPLRPAMLPPLLPVEDACASRRSGRNGAACTMRIAGDATGGAAALCDWC